MYITTAVIKQLASSPPEYCAGYRDYNSRGIYSYRRGTNQEGQTVLSSNVLDSEQQSYSVTIALSGDGRPIWYQCGCSKAVNGAGLCRHGVALLFRYIDDQKASSVRPASQLLKKNGVLKDTDYRRTDYHAIRMLERYQSEEDGQVLANSMQTDDKLSAHLCLSFDLYKRLQLSMTIGQKRQYIVKDLALFCADMEFSRTSSYGKNLKVVHHMDSFLPQYQGIVKFVLDKYKEYQSFYVHGSGIADKRYLPLSPSALDQLFQLYAEIEQPLSLRLEKDAQEKEYIPVTGDPSLEISVRWSPSGFTFSTDSYRIFHGEEHCYLLIHNTIHCCPESFTQRAGEFLDTLARADGYLYIAHKEMPSFCGIVLPAVRDILNFTGDLEKMETFFPDPLEVEFFLDAPSRSRITAKVVYRYGQEEFNPYAAEQPQIQGKRDRRGEFKMKILTQKQFPHIEPDRSRLYLEGSDEELYQFISEGLPALMQNAAAVHVTDRFTGIGILPSSRVSVGVRMENDLLEMEIDAGDFPLEELTEVLSAYRLGQKYYRLTDGRFLQLEGNAFGGLSQLVDGLDLTREQLREHAIRIPQYRALYLDKVLSGQGDVILTRDRYYRNLLRGIKAVEDSEFEVPDSLRHVLRNYQKVGFRWLRTMEQYRFGGILADDMGLGKTLQVIALLLAYREEPQENCLPSLVVCPTSLVYNWESEIRRFAPSLQVLTVTGDTAQRKEEIASIDQFDVAVTSYDLLKRDIPLYEGLSFQYHIIDEAQYIKNHTTQNAKAVKVIQSRQRFALTGTPVENRLSELWSIFDFLMPGFLYSYSRFREKFELPIVKLKDQNALEQLSKLVLPFVLRRMKKEVLKELPSKTETILYATMSGEQRKVYLAYAAQARKQVAEDMTAPGSGNRILFLSMLTRLRQLCCDPSLCLENYEGGGAKEDVCIELIRSAKEGGHKVLLFSQFTSMLSILEKRLEREEIRYFTLKGSTSKENRTKMVNQFNRDDTDVFLISLKAGGTGLNLTAADVVIHYDPWWNLSAQNQATDRAYRIGQKNSVQVYKIIAKDTIEEKICKMQEAKQELAESVIQAGDVDGAIMRMSGEQLMEILE